jgi:hypothetical protein
MAAVHDSGRRCTRFRENAHCRQLIISPGFWPCGRDGPRLERGVGFALCPVFHNFSTFLGRPGALCSEDPFMSCLTTPATRLRRARCWIRGTSRLALQRGSGSVRMDGARTGIVGGDRVSTNAYSRRRTFCPTRESPRVTGPALEKLAAQPRVPRRRTAGPVRSQARRRHNACFRTTIIPATQHIETRLLETTKRFAVISSICSAAATSGRCAWSTRPRKPTPCARTCRSRRHRRAIAGRC